MTDFGPALSSQLPEKPHITPPVDTDFEPVKRLSTASAEAQATSLRRAIRVHDRRYYVEHDPIIGDRTYDALFDRLQELESEFGLETATSPTARVGGGLIDGFESVDHGRPLLSIQQSGEASDVRDFAERVRVDVATTGVTWACEPKFDGISLAVTYVDGELSQAVTRGDGETGDNVTANAKTVNDLPLKLRGDPPSRLTVRGELVIPKDRFQAYNAERIEAGKEPFANPRNAVAGTVHHQDPSVVADRPLSFFAFSIHEIPRERRSDRVVADRQLMEYGFRTSDLLEQVDDIDGAIAYRDRLLSERDELNVAIDGVVIKADDWRIQEAMGATSTAPRWAFAYKFPPRSEETVVREVVLQVGRTGRVTPVALLDPVDVGGVTVARASLHNPDEIQRLGVDVGDRVRVERAGDVIPQVGTVVSDESGMVYSFPNQCPVCGNRLNMEEANARCEGGLACSAQQRRAIQHYTSRAGLDIDGVGEETIDRLLEAGYIETVADLYELTAVEIAALDGFGQRSGEKLVRAIGASKTPPLPDFLAALGIREVGETVAKTLAREFETFEAVRSASESELQAVEDIGPVTAQRIRDYFVSEGAVAVLDDLLAHVSPERYTLAGGEAFAGETIVFTGSLPTLSRSEATEVIEREGGSVTSSVSSNTDLLVVGESPGARKQNAAEEYETPTMSGGSFEQRLKRIGI